MLAPEARRIPPSGHPSRHPGRGPSLLRPAAAGVLQPAINLLAYVGYCDSAANVSVKAKPYGVTRHVEVRPAFTTLRDKFVGSSGIPSGRR